MILPKFSTPDCTVTVPNHLHMQACGVWMAAWLAHSASGNNLSYSYQDESIVPDFENLDIYFAEIFQKYGIEKEYELVNPVFLDTTNTNIIILLTHCKKEHWHRVELTKWLDNQQQGKNTSSPPSSLYEDTSDELSRYLELICISPLKHKIIMDTLLSNEIKKFPIQTPQFKTKLAK
ncbi:hypothetical protein VP01_3849g1 [Puccinia sorghi]|uniref:Uncharacterized protein n=1 Tax=Puccinia sorghi TaxID=27349 RepID=A0A0L6UV12_9BASI|nr:hypothetical protein VP01_3849g1 [Puccinia sorghi]